MKPERNKPKTDSGTTGDSVQSPVSGLSFRPAPMPPGRSGSFFRSLLPLLLVFCVALVVFWEVMANRSRRSFQTFEMGAADFSDFHPTAGGWLIERADIKADDPAAPNLFALRLSGNKTSTPALVRLVHGYNMPDCMRLKGYKVELIRDEGGDLRPETGNLKGGEGDLRPETKETDAADAHDGARPPSGSGIQVSGLRSQVSLLPRLQTWRLTSDIGDVSIACTAIIRATDFGGTELSVLDMEFPRIAKPIGPEWDIVGFRMSSLRHPIKSLVMYFKVKWNNARCDLLTFLRLRQPAWASSDYMTFLAMSLDSRVEPGDEARVARDVIAAHAAVYGELCRWRAAQQPVVRDR